MNELAAKAYLQAKVNEVMSIFNDSIERFGDTSVNYTKADIDAAFMEFWEDITNSQTDSNEPIK